MITDVDHATGTVTDDSPPLDPHAQYVADCKALGNPRMNRRARRAYLATKRRCGREEIAQEAARRTLATR